MRKRIIAIIITFILVVSFASCGASGTDIKSSNMSSSSSDNASGSDQASTQSKEEGTKDIAPDRVKEVKYEIDNLVIVDNDSCKVTIVSATKKSNGGVDFKFNLENKTPDKKMMFSIDDTAVNGWLLSSLFVDSVAAGKKSNETLSFGGTDLKDCGITAVDKLEFYLRVYDEDDWTADEFVDDVFTIFPTGLAEEDIISPERMHTENEVVLIDDDKCAFVILGSYEDSIWGYTVVAYLENKTSDTSMMFSWDDVSVNGYMVDPFWASGVSAGNKKLSTISFSTSKFEENDIETVEEIEFELRVYDDNNWSSNDFVKDTFTYFPEP